MKTIKHLVCPKCVQKTLERRVYEGNWFVESCENQNPIADPYIPNRTHFCNYWGCGFLEPEIKEEPFKHRYGVWVKSK